MTHFPDVVINRAKIAPLAKNNKVKIKEIFVTYQGEMPFLGHKAVFVRFGGCNRGTKTIGCEFCDTRFEWDSSTEMTFEEMKDRIFDLYKDGGCELVVFTGGEPYLQREAIEYFLSHTGDDFTIQVETNGDYELIVSYNLYNVVSPKASLAGKFSVRPYWNRACALRFLVEDRESPHIKLPDNIKKFILTNQGDRCMLYLSPITAYKPSATEAEIQKGFWGKAIDLVQTKKNYEWAAYLADALNNAGVITRLSLQSHLMFHLK